MSNLEQYLRHAEVQFGLKEFIFRLVLSQKNHKTWNLKKENKLLSNSRELAVLETLWRIWFPKGDYLLHSLRSGGPSAAVIAGIKDHLLKRHGRRVCETVRDRYVEDNLDNLLSASRKLRFKAFLLSSHFVCISWNDSTNCYKT